MKKRKKSYISTILTILILLLFGIYIFKNPDILITLRNIELEYIIFMITVFLVVFLLEGLFVKVTLKAFEQEITIKESFYLSTFSRIGNYLLPMRAGAIFRATYLKQKYNFDYSKFLSTLYGYYIILFLLYSTFGLSSLIIKWFVNDQKYLVLVLFFLALFIAMLFLMFVRIRFGKIIKNSNGLLRRILQFLDRFMTGWDRIVLNKKLLLQLIVITFGHIVLNSVIIYIQFVSLGINSNILELVLYSALSGVSLLISITPGSLGIREAVFLISSKSLDLNQEQIIQLAILDRAVLFILLLVMVIVFSIFVKEYKFRDVFFAKKEN